MKNSFYKHNSREATQEELSEITGLDKEVVEKYLSYSRAVLSLDFEYKSSESSRTMADTLADDTIVEVSEIISSQLTAEQLSSLINQELHPRHATVIKLRFGLTGDEQMTLQEVANIMGITRERVRQIEGKAIRKLRVAISKR